MDPTVLMIAVMLFGLVGYFVVMANRRTRLFCRQKWRAVNRVVGRVIRMVFWLAQHVFWAAVWMASGAVIFIPIMAWILFRLYRWGYPLLPPDI